MKAIILAAGMGTRLRPVTLTMPKPLVPVANSSLIEYAINMIATAGMSEVGIVVNSMDSPIVAQLGDGEKNGVKLSYIIQEEQLGLAHAVNLARDFVGDEPFAMFLGDNIFKDKMTDLLQNFPNMHYEAAVSLGEVADPSRFGVAEVQGDLIVRLVEKPKDPPSNLAVSGVYVFRKSIFDAIARIQPSARGELEITDAIQLLISEDQPVHAKIVEGWWIDAGKPNAIIQANQFVLGDMPYTPPPENENIINSDVSHRVVLGANTRIINSVVRGPAIIGDNVTIQDSYVGPYTSIGDNSVIEESEVDASIIMKNCVLRAIPGRMDSSLVADNSEVVSASQKLPAARRFILAENSYVQL